MASDNNLSATCFFYHSGNSVYYIFQVYYSDEVHKLSVSAVEGKCEVNRKMDLSSLDRTYIYDHIFFCERLYDPDKGSLKQVVLLIHLAKRM